MKQKLIWILFGVLALSGLSVVLYFGIQPRPVEQISISVFSGPTQIAESLIFRLRQQLINQNILFLGIDPEQELHRQVVSEFLKANNDPQTKFSKVIIDKGIQISSAENVLTLNLNEEQQQVLQILQEAQATNQRVLVILLHVNASQKIPGSLAEIITQQAHVAANSILFVTVPRSRDHESDLSIPCNTANADESGTGRLGCLILQKARSLYRKRFPAGKLVGYLDQMGAKDFVFSLAVEP